LRGPGRLEGFTFTNVGNADAGRVIYDYNGEFFSEISGTLRDGVCRGMAEGPIWGDYTGLDPDCDE